MSAYKGRRCIQGFGVHVKVERAEDAFGDLVNMSRLKGLRMHSEN